MNYLSVCSGIEAASVAWEPLGWSPIAFSEIEKFPSAVLSQRFPRVPNLGDMNNYKEWDIGNGNPIDVLVGGTPCQSFSVAGLRKGLDDPRGNLALVYCGILERFRPQWFVWENVPGVLSGGGGRDFGSFLGAVAQLGYGFAYRVLDAQHFGVPQRRRRVFVVGCLGDWRRAAAVLFERESLRGDFAKGGKAKQEVAKILRGRANSSHREDSDNFVPTIAKTLKANRGNQQSEYQDTFIPVTSRTLSARYDGSPCIDRGPEFIACTLPASDEGVSSGMHPVVAFDARQDPNSWLERTGPLDTDGCIQAVAYFDGMNQKLDETGVVPTMRVGRDSGDCVLSQAVAFAENSRGEVRLEGGDGSRTGALSTGGGKPGQGRPMVASHMAVRRLTPVECERLQGFPDNWTAIEYRGKPACDGPRYKAIGNSMAVPCMRWIGERTAKTNQ